MLRLLADENFNNQIVRGILRRRPEIDIVRVQDVGLSETDDRVILEWAAQQGRVLPTHDVETMTRYAYDRVQAGLEMPGVFEVSRSVPVGLATDSG
jgi:predicted nuclease of predicted toxin-antitoxin system